MAQSSQCRRIFPLLLTLPVCRGMFLKYLLVLDYNQESSWFLFGDRYGSEMHKDHILNTSPRPSHHLHSVSDSTLIVMFVIVNELAWEELLFPDKRNEFKIYALWMPILSNESLLCKYKDTPLGKTSLHKMCSSSASDTTNLISSHSHYNTTSKVPICFNLWILLSSCTVESSFLLPPFHNKRVILPF